MSFNGIIVGDHGQVATITFIDIDTKLPADISGYTDPPQMIFTDPDGTDKAKTAAFVTDGSDGKIKYTLESTLFDKAGWWQVRGRAKAGSAQLTTPAVSFYVSN